SGRSAQSGGPGPRPRRTHRGRTTGALGRGGARSRARDGGPAVGRARAAPASVLQDARSGRPRVERGGRSPRRAAGLGRGAARRGSRRLSPSGETIARFCLGSGDARKRLILSSALIRHSWAFARALGPAAAALALACGRPEASPAAERRIVLRGPGDSLIPDGPLGT